MKKNIKYFLAGFLAASVIAAIPVLAERIDAFMNTARINVDGVDRAVWGEEIDLGDGWFAPYSINYKDTLYLPLRKVSELSGKEVFWNGDSDTVSIVDTLKDKKVIAEKPDNDGNLWEYATCRTLDGGSYLTVTDGYRGYTRVYRAASTSVRVTDNEVYFMRLKEHNAVQNQGTLTKISFANDPDTQDGEALVSLYPMTDGNVFFDGDYVFFAGRTPGNGTHGRITAYNYMTNEEYRLDGATWTNMTDLAMTSSDGDRTAMEYTYSVDVYKYRMKTTFEKGPKFFTAGELVE